MLPSICGNTYSLEDVLSVVYPYYTSCAVWQKKICLSPPLPQHSSGWLVSQRNRLGGSCSSFLQEFSPSLWKSCVLTQSAALNAAFFPHYHQCMIKWHNWCCHGRNKSPAKLSISLCEQMGRSKSEFHSTCASTCSNSAFFFVFIAQRLGYVCLNHENHLFGDLLCCQVSLW